MKIFYYENLTLPVLQLMLHKDTQGAKKLRGQSEAAVNNYWRPKTLISGKAKT